MSPILDHTGQPFASAAAQSDPLYEAATVGGERLGYWGLSGSGPTAAAVPSIKQLRSRARQAVRNYPLAKGAVESLTSNMIGTGIAPRWQLDNAEQKEELQELFALSAEEFDYDGQLDFYGQQSVLCAAMVTDGACLSHLIDMPANSGLTVPFQVRLLESDHLDPAYSGFAPNGNEIRYGIEWRKGRRVAYWIDREHPGEPFIAQGGNLEKLRVPVEDMPNVFRPARPGAAHGSTWLSNVLVLLRDIDLYNDFELQRKKFAALLSGVLHKTEGQAAQNRPVRAEHIGGQSTNADKVRSVEIKPGVLAKIPEGYKVDFHDTPDVGSSYAPYFKTQFRTAARGLNLMYEQLTGDYEGVTFSSIRAGLIEFRRWIEMVQAMTIIHQFCRPVTARWLRAAVLNGVTKTISPKEYLANPNKFLRIEWQPQSWEFVNPVTDIAAEVMKIRNGIDSRTAVASRRGRDAEQVDRENAADSERARGRGLVYDSDPAQTNQSGTVQSITDSATKAAVEADNV
jgi:lambda family phage portal protein